MPPSMAGNEKSWADMLSRLRLRYAAMRARAQRQLQDDHLIDVEAGDVDDLAQAQRGLGEQNAGVVARVHPPVGLAPDAIRLPPRRGLRGGVEAAGARLGQCGLVL